VAFHKAKWPTGRTARKKYVPRSEQRADDERLRRELANAGVLSIPAKYHIPIVYSALDRVE